VSIELTHTHTHTHTHTCSLKEAKADWRRAVVCYCGSCGGGVSIRPQLLADCQSASAALIKGAVERRALSVSRGAVMKYVVKYTEKRDLNNKS